MSESILDMIRESESLADDAVIHSVNVTGEEDSTLFLLVVYHERYQGDVMLKERYFSVDLDEHTGGWTGKGINRRVTDSFEEFATSMVRTYARVQTASKNDSMDTAAEPLLQDAREGRGADVDDRLREPLGADESSESGSQESPIVDSRPTEESEPPKGHVRCRRCGETIDKRDAEQFSSGPPLGEVWVHSDPDACSEQGGDR